jgi:plastocyanin
VKKLIARLVVCLPLVVAACASAPKIPTTAEIKAVDIHDTIIEDWMPTSVEVASGGVVTWTNEGNMIHAVVSGEGLFPSQSLSPGQSFNFTFTQKGTFTYHDDPYNSVGTIYVR